MKILYVLVASTVLAGTGALAQQVSKTASGKEGSPFACDRLALNTAERRRHFDELGPQLAKLVRNAREAPGGYEFEFSRELETIRMVAEWVAGEYRCCPFFDIEMRLEREKGPLRLRLSGREGTKEFIRSDFKRWLGAAEGLR